MKVRLHNNDPSPAKATDVTIQGLPMCEAELKKDPDGSITLDEDGLAEVIGSNLEFVKFAILNQGYVKEVI